MRAFSERVALFVEDMRYRRQLVGSSSAPLHYEEDARSLASVPESWADLVLTSPPYANNYDYADAARLEMTFLGDIAGWGDLRELRDQLMKSCSQQMGRWDADDALASSSLDPIRDELRMIYGSLRDLRHEKAGKKAYHQMVVGYFYDSAQVFDSLRRVSRPGARVCYVVGDSAPYGVHVPVQEFLGALALNSGFRSWSFDTVRERNTKWRNRKHRVPLLEGHLWIEG